ncbi:hypothetical protein Bca4012_056849 [Brassica carinata]
MGCICATARTPTAAVANNELLDSSKSTLHLISHPPSSSSSLSKKEGSFTRPSSAASITVVANGHPVVRRPSTSSDRNGSKPVVIVGAPSRNHSRRVTAMQVVQQPTQQLRAEDKKRRRGETVTRGQPKDVKTAQTPESMAAGQSKVTCISHKFKTDEEGGTGFRIEPPRRGGSQQNGYAQASSMVHPSVADTEWNRGGSIRRQTNAELKSRIVQTGNLSGDSCRRGSNRDYSTGNAPMKNRIIYSGPLMPPGGNLEEMLKEHEKQIQQAVRKARVEKYG